VRRQVGYNPCPLSSDVNAPPKLFARVVVVEVLLAGGPVVVVVLQTLHRLHALRRARVLFGRNV